MFYVFSILERMHAEGNGSFAAGFDKLKPNGIPNQYIEHDGLVKRLWGLDGSYQRYAVMKGAKEHWKPLVRIEHF